MYKQMKLEEESHTNMGFEINSNLVAGTIFKIHWIMFSYEF